MLLALSLKRLKRFEKTAEQLQKIREEDPFDLPSRFELQEDLSFLMGSNLTEITQAASFYFLLREYGCAEALLSAWRSQNKENPLISFYIVYAQDKAHKPCHEEIKRAASCKNAICFPNQLMDIVVLHQANALEETALAHYYLGNLFYDKRQYELARSHWLASERLDPKFPTVKRNLSLYFYNKAHDPEKALSYMEQAWALDQTDSRILLELSQLYQLIDVIHRIEPLCVEHDLEVLWHFPEHFGWKTGHHHRDGTSHNDQDTGKIIEVSDLIRGKNDGHIFCLGHHAEQHKKDRYN